VSNEKELASLRDVEPDDSVSCVATKAGPFEDRVFELQPSILSVIDEIFHPPQTATIESNVYLDANHETKGSSSPNNLVFDSTPAMVSEAFSPSSFDQEFEKEFHQALVALKEDVDAWKRLDLELDRRIISANEASTLSSSFSPRPRRINPHNTSLYMKRYDPRISHFMGRIMDARPDYTSLVKSQSFSLTPV
jgi:hypothetical protein